MDTSLRGQDPTTQEKAVFKDLFGYDRPESLNQGIRGQYDEPVLGRKVTEAVKTLDTFPTPPGCTNVILNCKEVTSLCPVTGQPDFYNIEITYSPGSLCVESKSLKLYLLGFRNEGHFCEALAGIITRRFMEDAQPKWVKAEVHQTSRGGIEVIGVSSYTIGQFLFDQKEEKNASEEDD